MSTLHETTRSNCQTLFERLRTGGQQRVYNLSIPHLAVLLIFSGRRFIAVEDSVHSALALHQDLFFFRQLMGAATIDIPRLIPPADSVESVGRRASALLTVWEEGTAGLVTSVQAIESGFSLADLDSSIIALRQGEDMARDLLEERLRSLGYRSVSLVVEPGEYSRRGWLFDIYPSAGAEAVRIEFYGDEIDGIRFFDVESQRSLRDLDNLTILPAVEPEAAHNILAEITSLREFDLYWAARDVCPSIKGSSLLTVSHLPVAGNGIDSGELTLAGLGLLPGEFMSIEDRIRSLLAIEGIKVVVLASDAQARRFRELLRGSDVFAPILPPSDLSSFDGNLCITTGKVSGGFRIPGLAVVSDREIFGERPSHRPLKRSRVSRLLLTVDDLKAGDFVVHRDHGIGKFVALQRLTAEGYEGDIITLEYSGGDRVYVPVHGIGMLRKYSAGEAHLPTLDRLGGKGWQRVKQKVKEGVMEMAEKLVKLYAERSLPRGFLFSDDTPLHREFDDFFPYEETPDQIKAFEQIKEAFRSDTPMDMLVCGDVGYGKTEVAMKAAFRTVFDGRQVAVLVPTTLLAEQHYRNFRTRFSGFPVNIDHLSRFKNRAAAMECKKALARGELDIVIGTHMLLAKDVRFSNLGLLIIDEEHRFGVAQKERLKELRKGVDVVTLSATPIPRTLHMSLSGIREMALIETPPEERLAVKSFVTTFDRRTIQEAISRELLRQGQIFYVHNRIQDIEQIYGLVNRLVPEARVTTAHGQMLEAELEKIMIDFMDHAIDVLVCTSIIGSGIDIPSANTIIIDRADQFGLADLYQLRGRVGRGALQAYAYFIVPGEETLTEEARKRIQAIQEMSYLGAGFRLAMRDLEIRGAGNLLGKDQSGHIYKVGFEMYMEMLERAVAELKGEAVVEEWEPQIQVRVPAYIPENYIADTTLRLSAYRRLSAVKSPEALADLVTEIDDRFGTAPLEVRNLGEIIRVRLLARHLFIGKITVTDGGFRCYFLVDNEQRYGIPEGFFDRLLKALLSFSANKTSKTRGKIRLLVDGFSSELPKTDLQRALAEVVNALVELEMLMGGGNCSASSNPAD